MLVKLKNWLVSPTFEDKEKTHQANLLNITLFTIIGFMSAAAIIRIMGSNQLDLNTLITIGTIGLSSLILQFMLRQGYIRSVSILILTVNWLALTYQIWAADGIRDIAFVAYIILILLANLLLGWQAGLSVAGLSIAAGWIFALAEKNGLIVPNSDPPFLLALDMTIVFSLVAMILALTTAYLNNTLRRATASERSFSKNNQELEAIKNSLESQVAERTHNLELVANLSNRLVSILDLNQLLAELTSQTKAAFNFYGVHIYRLDQQTKTLIMTQGTGQAAAEMQAKYQSISLETSLSLVARAARSRQVVRVDDVRESPGWLPSPLLPDACSEMAIPIVVDDEVVGVLDVIQDKIAALDDGHESALRSLASQVAVAMRNARIFAEIEQALQQARQVQARYTEQSWSDAKTRQHKRQMFQPAGSPPPPEELRAKLKQLALSQQKATPVTIEESDLVEANPKPVALISPVRLGDQAIGTLQLHRTENNAGQWSEGDLALVEAVLDQVAQTAENLRLFDETRERANYERTVGEITRKLRQAPNLETLTKVASEALGQVLGVSGGTVSLYSQPAQTSSGRLSPPNGGQTHGR